MHFNMLVGRCYILNKNHNWTFLLHEFFFFPFFFARIFFLGIFPCMNFFLAFSPPPRPPPHHFSNGPSLRNRSGRSGVQVKTENKKFPVVCSRSPQNLEFGHFVLLFCRGRQRNVPKFIAHVQRLCFSHYILLF